MRQISISELFPNLSDINFCTKDPDAITQEVISRYELFSGRTLARADPVRLFLNAVILEFVQQRNAIDYAAKMNLLAYAKGKYLDHLGAFYGTERLGASNASCTVKFSLRSPLTFDAIIPEGIRVTPDGKIYFAVADTTTIPAGETEALCVCVCETAGTIGNDYVAGQISLLVDLLPYDLQVVNVDTSSGGTDEEEDEPFRERIHIAPESFSTAGPKKAYEYFALSADPNIADAKVLTPPETEPGFIEIYILLKGGVIPDTDMLEKVLKVCSAEDIRPDSDYVAVMKPHVIEYGVDVQYWIDAEKATQSSSIQEAVAQAVLDWTKWQYSRLGRDINPSRLIHDITAAGAKRCEIITPEYTMLSNYQIAKPSGSFNVRFMGLE